MAEQYARELSLRSQERGGSGRFLPHGRPGWLPGRPNPLPLHHPPRAPAQVCRLPRPPVPEDVGKSRWHRARRTPTCSSTFRWTRGPSSPRVCKHCYAETFAERFRGVPGHPFEQGFDLRLVPEKLDEPLRWRAPRRIFVNSMSDLFHEDVPDGLRRRGGQGHARRRLAHVPGSDEAHRAHAEARSGRARVDGPAAQRLVRRERRGPPAWPAAHDARFARRPRPCGSCRSSRCSRTSATST